MHSNRALSTLVFGGALFIAQCSVALATTSGPDVSLTSTGPLSVMPGDQMRLSFTARNIGDVTAQRTFVVIRIPYGTRFDTRSDRSCTTLSNSVVCYGVNRNTGFDLGRGESQTFTVIFDTMPTQCGGTITTDARAQVIGSSDVDGRNNDLSVSTKLACTGTTSRTTPVVSTYDDRFPQGTIILDDADATFPQNATRKYMKGDGFNGSYTEISGNWSEIGKTAGQALLQNTTFWTPHINRGMYDVYMTWNPRDVSTIPTRLRFRVRASDLETHQLEDQYGVNVYEQRGVQPQGPTWAGRTWEKIGTVQIDSTQNLMFSLEFAGSSALTQWTYAVDALALVQPRYSR